MKLQLPKKDNKKEVDKLIKEFAKKIKEFQPKTFDEVVNISAGLVQLSDHIAEDWIK